MGVERVRHVSFDGFGGNYTVQWEKHARHPNWCKPATLS